MKSIIECEVIFENNSDIEVKVMWYIIIYGFCRSDGTDELQGRLSDCVIDVALWMWSNRLQLNVLKIEEL